MIRYFDAGALIKRYVREAGSAEVRRLLAAGVPATSRLSGVEVASALVRRCREGAFPASERDRALASLRRDLAGMPSSSTVRVARTPSPELERR